MQIFRFRPQELLDLRHCLERRQRRSHVFRAIQSGIKDLPALRVLVNVGVKLRTDPAAVVPQFHAQLFLCPRSEISVQDRPQVAVRLAQPKTAALSLFPRNDFFDQLTP